MYFVGNKIILIFYYHFNHFNDIEDNIISKIMRNILHIFLKYISNKDEIFYNTFQNIL